MKIQRAARFSEWTLRLRDGLNARRLKNPVHRISWLVRRPPNLQSPRLEIHSGPYTAVLATRDVEREAAYKLRFRVFNLELNEGMEHAYATGADHDEFDRFCDHINVRDERTGHVVGTYRLQSGFSAARHIGYYSEREFHFAPYEQIREELVELGRACIHPEHRKYDVLMLLWKAIARYAVSRKARYLIGCSSLSSQDTAAGAAVYERVKSSLAPETFRTSPLPHLAFSDLPGREAQIPKLLRTYLCLGAWICAEPAIDREFRTIDFLTLLDLNNLSQATRSRLLD